MIFSVTNSESNVMNNSLSKITIVSICVLMLLLPSMVFADVVTPYNFSKKRYVSHSVGVVEINGSVPIVQSFGRRDSHTAPYLHSTPPLWSGSQVSAIGAKQPTYVPAISGDIAPFGFSSQRLFAPPTTGGDVQNPTVVPLNDALSWFMLLLLLYALVTSKFTFIRTFFKKK